MKKITAILLTALLLISLVQVVSFAATVSKPTASVASGTYSAAQKVTLKSATSGAVIYYTLNGATPTSKSTKYTGAISIAKNTTLKAVAVKSGMSSSAVLTVAYYIRAAAPTAGVAAGTYSSAQKITLKTTASSAKIYYTLDGSTPTTKSKLYTGAITVSKNTTVKAITVKSGMANSTVLSRTYYIRTAAPSASPAAGTFTTAQKVTLKTAVSDAKIYYTVDGTTPTTKSKPYSGATIAITKNTTLKAIAVKSGYANSSVVTKAYAIRTAAPSVSLAAGTYSASQKVTLKTAVSGAKMYYTLDGSTPTSKSTLYSGAITVSKNVTLKAVAVKSGYANSSVVSRAYAIRAAKPTASLAAGTYYDSQKVTLKTTTGAAAIYYTLDGSTPTTSSKKYFTALTLSKSVTIKAVAVKSGLAASPVLSVSYTIIQGVPVSGTVEQFVSSYNTAANTLKSEKNFKMTLKYSEKLEFLKPDYMAGMFAPETIGTTVSETFVNGKGVSDPSNTPINSLPVFGKSYVSVLQAKYVSTAVAKKYNTITRYTITLKPETVKLSAAAPGYHSCFNDIVGDTSMMEGFTLSSNSTASYSGGKIVADVNSSGQVVKLNLYQVATISIPSMKMDGFEMEIKDTQFRITEQEFYTFNR